jgi:hypothetical protein
MNDIDIRQELLRVFPPDARADWADVLGRARQRRFPTRRLTLAIAAILFVLVAGGSALALTGHLGNLLRGTPVNDLTPRERYMPSQFDMDGRVELIATRDSTAFYVIRRRDGRRCYSIGDADRTGLTPAQREARVRFGATGCIDPRVFPSRAWPVLDFSFFSYRRGDRSARLAGLHGFAADPVARIGVIGKRNEIAATVPVDGNVYTAGKRGFPGARGVVALAHDGRILWVQCLAGRSSPAPQFPSGDCGKYKNSRPPALPASPQPKRPPEPANPVRQSGSADGIMITIRGSHIRATFAGAAANLRRKLIYKDGRVVFGCFKLVNVGGSLTASGTYVTKPYAPAIEISPWRPAGRPGRPSVQYAPFDACTISGNYGHSWGDANGTHDAVEIPLTSRAQRYLTERAVARDIAWLARSRIFRNLRYARSQVLSHDITSLGNHVVRLHSPDATPPVGKLGIWLGEPRHIVLAERATTGRRLYLELRHGVQYRTNLTGLASVL